MDFFLKESPRQSHAHFLTYSSICIYSVKRSLEHKCSDFMLLSSFSVAEALSTNRLLQYFMMMYMLSSANTLEESHWVTGTSQLGPLGGFFMNARNWEVSFVFLSDDVCPSSHIYWKEHCSGSLRCVSHHLTTWLWVVGEEAGGGETKKTEMVNYCRFLRKMELEAFVVRMKIAHFLSARTTGLRVLRGIENK